MKNHKEEAPVFARLYFSLYNWNALIFLFFTSRSWNIRAFSLGCISLRSAATLSGEKKKSLFISYGDTAWGRFPPPCLQPKRHPQHQGSGSKLTITSVSSRIRAALQLMEKEATQTNSTRGRPGDEKSTDWGPGERILTMGSDLLCNKGYSSLLNSIHFETQPVFKQHAAASGKLPGLENQTEGCLGSLSSSHKERKTEVTLRRQCTSSQLLLMPLSFPIST